jgi:phosphoglycolate phosphatase
MMAGPRITAVFFDLDGTLLDTAPDLAYAVNLLRAEEDLALLPCATLRPAASHGSPALLRVGLGITPEDPRFSSFRDRFLAHYRTHLARETQPFPGILGVLDHLDAHRIPWGVITNKPAGLTVPLLEALKLFDRAACVVSGDTLPLQKPHPEPLLHAAGQIHHPPARCLYVGDAERDVEAGRRAGMVTLVALFGYLAPTDAPEAWGATGLIDHPDGILPWLETR